MILPPTEEQVDFSSGSNMNGLTAPVTELIFSRNYDTVRVALTAQ